MKVVVIGAGKVGSALAGALAASGVEVLAVAGRGPLPPELSSADAVIVAVPDAAIAEVGAALAGSGRLATDAAVLHTAGALPPAALGAGLAHPGTLHPLQTFAKASPPPLAGVPFAIAGDERALAVARSLAERVGGVAVVIPDEARSLYHAAAVLACGHVATLAGAAARALARAARVTEPEALRLLAPILRATAGNLASLGLPDALTGPAARGDVETMRRHAAALGALDPALAEAYAAVARLVGWPRG